ncbi:hypothetical protein [Martelella endophytica]|uniref:Uncharacterized protein n=1 Tax=Martelella endophytica TaxID=1486262 RepID=A0A0D5LU57_MAREN|nr:hypothetical protein [Martelella endophytica]AJY47596.1 hypothetical protein TM49_21065 [Martelella endophytica]
MNYRILAYPLALIALMSFAPAGLGEPQPARQSFAEWGGDRLAWTCDFKGEDSDGFDKICAYDCAGSRKEIKIDKFDHCPASIKV